MTSIATLTENVSSLQEDTDVGAGKIAALEKRLLLIEAQQKGSGSLKRAASSPSSSSPQA